MNETTVTVVGNVASDPKARRVGDDARVVGFRIASSERRWDRAQEAWVDGDRFSAWVTCWRRLGDGVSVALVKGDPVIVHGRLSVREYEVGGERRYSTEIVASAVGPDLARSTATVSRRRPPEAAPGTAEGDGGSAAATGDLTSPADAEEVASGGEIDSEAMVAVAG